MMLLIAGLALVVVYLAVKSPDPNMADKQSLPPNDNVPALGAVGNPSPAMSKGAPVASQTYRTAMTVNAATVGSAASKFTAGGSVKVFNSAPGTLKPPSQTVAEMGKALMTQAPPTLASVRTNPGAAPKIKL